jgi:hypothetical protein
MLVMSYTTSWGLGNELLILKNHNPSNPHLLVVQARTVCARPLPSFQHTAGSAMVEVVVLAMAALAGQEAKLVGTIFGEEELHV